jgi:hypothetical protein
MEYWIDGDERPRWLRFVAGVAVGALLVGLIWLVQWRASDGSGDDPPTEAGAQTTVGEAQAGPEESPDRSPDRSSDRLTRCQEVFAAQDAPLQAARPSLSQWQIHVGAMNKLVTGAITLEQATEFWDDTRVAADRRLARYESAAAQYDQRTARCPRAGAETLTPTEAHCAQAVAARGRALSEASISLATWREHVHHMEMLRMGEMSPAEATQLWLASWKQGVRELRAYGTAARAAEERTC